MDVCIVSLVAGQCVVNTYLSYFVKGAEFFSTFYYIKLQDDNKNIFDMKRTVFTGTINGQTFDNVTDYNKCMMQLLEKGVEVQASSSTSIKEVEVEPEPIDTFASTPDDGVSLFPFFEEGAEYYLDALVTPDTEKNLAMRTEMRKLLEKCYSYIMEMLLDKDIDTDEKLAYRDNIHDLISNIEADRNNNLKCKGVIAKRRDEAIAKYNAAKAEYNEAMIKFRAEEFMIDSANPIINMLLDFYRDIEAEAISAVKNDEDCCETCCCDECTCGCTDPNKNTPVNKIHCNVRETQPQTFKDVTDWFNKLLEECGVKLS